MSPLSEATVVDDALGRLVRSVVGQDEELSHTLARRILSSSVGERTLERSLSSAWRRIERSTCRSTREEIETLYEKLKQVTDPQLAERLVVVLSKLAKQSSSNDSRAAAPPPVMASDGRIEKLTHDRQLLAKQVKREETLLLRECLYALQGIDGERIRYIWSEGAEDSIRVRACPLLDSVSLDPEIPSRIGSGAEDALRLCGEAGWLHHRVQTYIKEGTKGVSHGIVSRALVGALSCHLQDYYSLLASVESDLMSSGLTLRQLLVDLHQPTFELRTMAMVTDGVGHLSGGCLLSALYQHSLHGDTRHACLIQNLLSRASQPWYQWLYLWTTRGELVDPHKEFFIVEHTSIDDKYLWRDRYTIRDEQIVPIGILDYDLVHPAWILGKGINFIRKCLLDAEWRINLGERLESANDEEHRNQLGYQYMPESGSSCALRRTLLSVGEQVHSHILKSLRDDHRLMDHLWGLKCFLFLGQGDFFSAFMDGLHAELQGRKGLAGLYKHSIMAIMEEAVRSTNARQLPSYVFERLQIEVTIEKDDDAFYQLAAPLGEEGQDQRSPLDFICLDYVVPDTLTTIVDEFAMKRYKLVFSLLFRLKRVEFVLNATWRQSTALHHAMQTFAQHNAIQVSTSQGYSRALVLLRTFSMARQSMMHFVGNLKSYFMYEVLEGGWKDLERHVEAARTLDEVIEAHDRYLEGIVRKSLVGGTSESAATKSETAVSSRLQELLMIAKSFCELQERLFSDALSAVERATEKREEAERRLEEGKWGFNKEEDFIEEESFFGLTDVATLQKVDRILDDFNEKTLLLLEGLHVAANSTAAAGAVTIECISPATPASRSKAKGLSTWNTIGSETVSDPFDHDSLRFLAFQLNYSAYFGEKY